ncbi:hypothetical protein ACFQUU_13755 [Herbaspirillum sp. GCM10030257]|uniref:hypothetical protein n=1 Tax=Herbaspirillum sp. GCM10030257 TaxID=3273393 RepID=UPI0036179F1F
MENDEIEQWLQEQPLDEPVEIDGESVYLKVGPSGAELGAYLIQSYTQVQLHEALKLGFKSALRFDAGLGQTPDGSALVLTQWLPQVSGWSEAAEPLENILNQLSMWRAALTPEKPRPASQIADRNEQRLRMLFAGAK